MKRIEDACINYLLTAVPQEAGGSQLIETRRAFYAGAISILQIMVNCPIEEEEQLLDNLLKELGEFASQIKNGKA